LIIGGLESWQKELLEKLEDLEDQIIEIADTEYRISKI